MQNTIIIITVLICAYFIGRRLYKTIKSSQSSTGCGCSCSGCGVAKQSTCHSENKPDNAL